MPTPETELEATERLLREKLALAGAAERAAASRSPRAALLAAARRLLRRQPAPAGKAAAGKAPGAPAGPVDGSHALAALFSAAAAPAPARTPAEVERDKRDRRGDLIMATLGVALGLTCAVFPWYIFFNQEQFGVQAIKFGGRGGNAGRSVAASGPGSGAQPFDQAPPDEDLDPFATGTLSSGAQQGAPGLDQPFPVAVPTFRLVHVANGRAMIEDDAGLWVVQPGTVLPDASRVRAIEKRNGRWVLVTSTDRVLEMAR